MKTYHFNFVVVNDWLALAHVDHFVSGRDLWLCDLADSTGLSQSLLVVFEGLVLSYSGLGLRILNDFLQEIFLVIHIDFAWLGWVEEVSSLVSILVW